MSTAHMVRGIVKAYRRYDIDQHIGHFRAYRRLYRTLSRLAMDLPDEMVSTVLQITFNSYVDAADRYIVALEEEREQPRFMGSTRTILGAMGDMMVNPALPRVNSEETLGDVLTEKFMRDLFRTVRESTEVSSQ